MRTRSSAPSPAQLSRRRHQPQSAAAGARQEAWRCRRRCSSRLCACAPHRRGARAVCQREAAEVACRQRRHRQLPVRTPEARIIDVLFAKTREGDEVRSAAEVPEESSGEVYMTKIGTRSVSARRDSAPRTEVEAVQQRSARRESLQRAAAAREESAGVKWRAATRRRPSPPANAIKRRVFTPSHAPEGENVHPECAGLTEGSEGPSREFRHVTPRNVLEAGMRQATGTAWYRYNRAKKAGTPPQCHETAERVQQGTLCQSAGMARARQQANSERKRAAVV